MAPPWEYDRTTIGWWMLGGVLFAALGFVVYSFIGTIVFGIFIYYATRPLYKRLRSRIRPASLAAATALLLLALPVILLLAYTVAIGLQESTRLMRQTDLGRLEGTIQPYLNVSTIPLTPDELFADPSGVAIFGDALRQASTYLGFLGTAALHLFVMIAIAFYLLRDGHRLSRWFRRRFTDEAGVVASYLDAVDRDYHNIFFGNILNAVMTASIGAIAYNVLDLAAPASTGIPYPSLLGLLAGVASLVPIVGMKLVYFPAAIYLGAQALMVGNPRLFWFPVTFAAVSFFIVDMIPDLVLRPYVSGRSLHIGMVMIAYIFGPLLFGWYGIFLGPMILVLIVQFTKLVLPELLSSRTISPVAIDPSSMIHPPEESTPEPTDEASMNGDDLTEVSDDSEGPSPTLPSDQHPE
ncbi:MAG: AI-2E family transporter [Halobacteriales archaeon]|nr:AI-2E family transporter [Halobacteriales archaeon]